MKTFQQDPSSSTTSKPYDFNTERFKTRLLARLCLVLVTLIQIFIRLVLVFTESGISKSSKTPYLTSIPLGLAVLTVIGTEYTLYSKIGTDVMKYTKIIDCCLLLFFTIEWVAVLFSPFQSLDNGDPPTISQTGILTFTAFGYRTLIQIFVIQNWKLRIIPPAVALGFVMGYELWATPHKAFYILFRGMLQVVIMIILFYFEDKMNWRMMLTNLRQEKWMQMNDFILNNIPENIMILDIDGETRLISDYCKSFLTKCNLPSDTKVLFQQIKDLQQQKSYENDTSETINPLNIERRISTVEGMIEASPFKTPEDLKNVAVFEDLLTSFKTIIKNKNIQEKQFLIYNGKLQTDDNSIDKSIEIKISFIEQLEKAYIILIIRDTTQRDLLIALEDNNKYKDQLLASVSHELRAPLNGNINLVETAIQSQMVPDDIKENLLEPALRSSKFLLHLINDILDMSQIKAQKLRLIFQSGNLKETLQDTVKLVEVQAKKKGLELSLEIDSQLSGNFCTDHLRLSQIVLNLLNNAIKFTKSGTVKLSAKILENLPCVRITIEDSGIGMSQENVQKLFAYFTHIEFEGRKSMNPNGVGLGLNIAHNLVGLLGPKGQNRIKVQSTPQQGSIFSFIIENKEDETCHNRNPTSDDSQCSECDLAVPNEVLKRFEAKPLMKLQSLFSSKCMIPPVEKPQEIVIKSECECAKVLIVDDNPFNTMAFETILGSLKLKCDAVYSGQAGIEKVVKRQTKICGKSCKQYNVIFMDKEMPEMTGIDTVKEIKRLQAEGIVGGNVKIIGCTAHGSKEEVDLFLASGIDLCIHKPISVGIIQKVLDGCGV